MLLVSDFRMFSECLDDMMVECFERGSWFPIVPILIIEIIP